MKFAVTRRSPDGSVVFNGEKEKVYGDCDNQKLSGIPSEGSFNLRQLRHGPPLHRGKETGECAEGSPVHQRKVNVIMIGPTGTGKTHLAMAIGNQCCDNNMKTYFIKIGKLKDRFHAAILAERQGRYLNGLSKYSCQIIDEIGYCHFDKAETLMFFHLIDRINLKESGSIVMTSNKDTSTWQELVEEDDALECTMDKLCGTAIRLTFSGCSYRGKSRERINLDLQKLRQQPLPNQ